ncbi:MAG: hypothetical protein OXD44_08590 [Gammaproteobacteria bacterium]|nr:hypothetical protein [Gammaproteobacteria bacterium]
MALALATPTLAQDIQAAADRSMVLDNTAKGITNNGILLTAIPGAPMTMTVPVKTTGYYGSAESVGGNIGTLALGSEGACPFGGPGNQQSYRYVNAYRAETTYTPGQAFRVHNCGLLGGEFWVGIRVYGMICKADDPSTCQSLENALANPEQYETDGYVALLKPGLECGPQQWPTEALRRAGAPAYAQWCDFGVKVR